MSNVFLPSTCIEFCLLCSSPAEELLQQSVGLVMERNFPVGGGGTHVAMLEHWGCECVL